MHLLSERATKTASLPESSLSILLLTNSAVQGYPRSSLQISQISSASPAASGRTFQLFAIVFPLLFCGCFDSSCGCLDSFSGPSAGALILSFLCSGQASVFLLCVRLPRSLKLVYTSFCGILIITNPEHYVTKKRFLKKLRLNSLEQPISTAFVPVSSSRNSTVLSNLR